MESLAGNVNNLTYLITGGCGTLGQALTKELLKYEPKAIRIFDNSEYAHWSMQEHFKDKRLRYFIGDIRDKDRLKRALHGVDVVVHAAALKHVHLCEYNPIDAIQTNIIGSVNLVEACLDCYIPKVIAISTDKAVHPVNLYGATKMAMEKLLIQSNVYGYTRFSCIRAGNFWTSKGSFISKLYQTDEDSTIEITDKDMMRFWIDIDSVSQFIIKCIGMMRGAEIFIPKMAEKNIMEIVSGILPNAKCKFIGSRPGERLQELLFAETEKPEDMGDYFVIGKELESGSL